MVTWSGRVGAGPRGLAIIQARRKRGVWGAGPTWKDRPALAPAARGVWSSQAGHPARRREAVARGGRRGGAWRLPPSPGEAASPPPPVAPNRHQREGSVPPGALAGSRSSWGRSGCERGLAAGVGAGRVPAAGPTCAAGRPPSA